MPGNGFNAQDIRGLEIICSGPDYDYIMHQKHDENYQLLTEERIVECLRFPQNQIIFVSNQAGQEHKHIYYKKFSNIKRELKVVVDFRKVDQGYLVSAVFVSKRAPGEKIKWTPALAAKRN